MVKKVLVIFVLHGSRLSRESLPPQGGAERIDTLVACQDYYYPYKEGQSESTP